MSMPTGTPLLTRSPESMATSLLDDREAAGVRGAVPSAILVVGLGSIGQRHLANLKTLGCHNLAVYRTGHGSVGARDAEVPIHQDLDSALGARPSAVVVANPTSLHVETAIAAARAGAHLFIEKPLSHSMTGVAELRAE